MLLGAAQRVPRLGSQLKIPRRGEKAALQKLVRYEVRARVPSSALLPFDEQLLLKLGQAARKGHPDDRTQLRLHSRLRFVETREASLQPAVHIRRDARGDENELRAVWFSGHERPIRPTSIDSKCCYMRMYTIAYRFAGGVR